VILESNPPKAVTEAEQAAAETGVFRNEEVRFGYGSMFIKAAAGDLAAFDQALELISRALKTLGDPGTPDQRRAKAVGIIANPQAAQDLIARAEAVRRAQKEAAAARRAGDVELAERIESTLPGEMPSKVDQKPFAWATAVLYLHMTWKHIEDSLHGNRWAEAGVVRVDDVGPVLLDQVQQWLQHASVVLKPVIDLDAIPPGDHYEASDQISDAIGLRRQPDSWPYGNSISRTQENEHTAPYVSMKEGGPPGQTDAKKMFKMTRRHHRIKTFRLDGQAAPTRSLAISVPPPLLLRRRRVRDHLAGSTGAVTRLRCGS
jgi:hypothetical protein